MKLRNKKTGEIVDLVEGYIKDSYYGQKIEIKPLAISNKEGYMYNSLAELNEEWEDVPEPKGYWYIRDDGSGVGFSPLDNSTVAQRRSIIGNYFESEEEAEKAVEWLKARKVLFDDAKGFKPNWKESASEWRKGVFPAHYVSYDYETHSLSTGFPFSVVLHPGPHFATAEDALASIWNHYDKIIKKLGGEE